MTARTWMVAGLGAVALCAGCGGGGGGGGEKPAAKPGGPPAAKEPLAAAAIRLQRAIPTGDCRVLAALMLHSAPRVSEPDSPPTPRECRSVRSEARRDLRGYRFTRAESFGPAGVSEGTGAAPGAGETVGVIWVLDRDGSWKAVFNAIYRTQIGLPPAYGARAAANAHEFVTAVATRDCDNSWRLLNATSRFVRSAEGHKPAFCRGQASLYRDPKSAYAQIAADPGAQPRELGQTRDLGFYGLQLRNGRYLVLVLSGRLGGVDAEQKQHDNPTVLEFLTLRRPTG